MDSDLIAGIIILLLGVAAFILLVAGEAGVVAGVRERAMKEPVESRVEALRRFYHERQLTLSSLTLARNLAVVGVTSIAVFLVLRETGRDWLALAATAVVIALAFVLLQALPRFLVAHDPQRWQHALGPFVSLVRLTFRGPVMLLDAPMEAVMRGLQRRHATSAGGSEELMLLTEMEQAGAALEEDEREMIRGVMELELTSVRKVMIPRTDIAAVDVKEGFEKLAKAMVEGGYSRIPVYEGNVDHVIGIAHGKEVMRHLARGGQQPSIRQIIRPAHAVPESKKVHELLAEMKQNQISMAIVVDEYGGTAGLVTIEDLLEEIVGEIRDEFDVQEQPVQLVTANEVIVDARVGIDELNEMFDMSIQKEDFDSVGGFIVNELGRMPSVGDTVRVNGISLKVLSVAGRRIKKVRVVKLEDQEQENAPAGA
ncbi:MAG: hemolysin family protein [Dehalococcoidia bacterium]|nr:hemolysin family protein [Dehalococcoidia bacterium]